MHILSIVFLGIAANLDNLGIGLSYGLRKIKIPFASNLVIAVLSGLAALITGFAGRLLSHVLPEYLCNTIGGSIVGAVGVWVVASGFFVKRNLKSNSTSAKAINNKQGRTLDIIRQPEKADIDYSGHISIKESILLGIALAVNCLATGLGAGMTGVSVIGMTASIMLFSLITIFLGTTIGKRCFSGVLGDKATVLAGVLLIVIGIYEIFI
jgi:putative sporulation protein YtaF